MSDLISLAKALEFLLSDARANPEFLVDVRKHNPMHTVPVLVDGERAISDSTAICHYLDRKLPDPPLWPAGLAGAGAFEFAALADSAIQVLVDLGMRCHALHDHPEFPTVRATLVGRAQRALDALAHKVSAHEPSSGPLLDGGWGWADIVCYTTVAWLEGLPKRAPNFAPAQHVVDLGWSLPISLSRWADQHRERADVRALG